MKKLIALTTTVMVFAIFMTSCQKEGVYNPKKKIEKIYGIYEGIKELEETWTWEKDLLTRVTYGRGFDYDSYEYNKKQLSKIISYEDDIEGSSFVFTYEKSKLLKIEEFYDGKLQQVINVEHDGKKIVKLIINDINDNIAYKSARSQKTFKTIMRNFVPQPIIDKMIENALHKANDYKSVIEFVYDGDNVIKTTMKDMEVEVSIINTYDNYLNPFYNNFFYGGESGSAGAFSKNNPLTASMTTIIDGEKMSINGSYTYVYDGKFPTEVTYSYKYFTYEFKSMSSYEYLK